MAAVRQRVPGVHDVISPEGRVCVEILDERGRVKQKVKSENAIMNFWNECQKRQIRGGDVAFTGTASHTPMTGYHFHGSTAALSSELDSGRSITIGQGAWHTEGLAAGWTPLGHPSAFLYGMRNVVVTDSTEAVNPDEFIFPGNLTAYTDLREQYAPSTNTKRGNMNTATSYRTQTSLRYVCEWGTAYGNGTHNSIGIGNIVADPSKATHGYQCLTPYLVLNQLRPANYTDSTSAVFASQIHFNHPIQHDLSRFFATPALPANPNSHFLSGFRVALNEFWTVQSGSASNNMARKDFSALTASPFNAVTAAAGHAVTGPTNTTIGSVTSQTCVAAIGSDLWLAYNGTLKRCVKPTNTSLTVTNTYTPAGIENCADITTDGTNLYWLGATTVYVIDPATGAISSSWAHGLTGNMGTLNWGGANSPYLMVAYEATGLANASTMAGMIARTSWLTALFTTAGVNKGQFQVPSSMYSSSSSNSYTTGGLIMPMTADNKHWFGPFGTNSQYTSTAGPTFFGPSHMSRTVLGAPVVKTSSNSMRVTYEFTF